METVRVKDLLLDEFEAIDDVDEVGDDASDDSSCILSHRLFLADTVPDLPSSFYRDNETKRKKNEKIQRSCVSIRKHFNADYFHWTTLSRYTLLL